MAFLLREERGDLFRPDFLFEGLPKFFVPVAVDVEEGGQMPLERRERHRSLSAEFFPRERTELHVPVAGYVGLLAVDYESRNGLPGMRAVDAGLFLLRPESETGQDAVFDDADGVHDLGIVRRKGDVVGVSGETRFGIVFFQKLLDGVVHGREYDVRDERGSGRSLGKASPVGGEAYEFRDGRLRNAQVGQRRRDFRFGDGGEEIYHVDVRHYFFPGVGFGVVPQVFPSAETGDAIGQSVTPFEPRKNLPLRFFQLVRWGVDGTFRSVALGNRERMVRLGDVREGFEEFFHVGNLRNRTAFARGRERLAFFRAPDELQYGHPDENSCHDEDGVS